MNILAQNATKAINQSKKCSTFMSVMGYTNSFGEIANYSIIFNISYKNALKKSINILKEYKPSTKIQETIKSQLINSFCRELGNINDNKQDNKYKSVVIDGNTLKGIKYHPKLDTYYVCGLVVHKRVLKSGYTKKYNVSSFQREKQNIWNMCPVSKYRMFKLNSKFERIVIDKQIISK